MKNVFFLLLTLFLTSCAGYSFKDVENPLAQFGINSISIPVFINNSSLSGMTGPFTKEMALLFSKYPKLKVYNYENKKSDAILIGIINSPPKKRDAIINGNKIYPAGELADSFGDRNLFYLPLDSTYSVVVQFILIKGPSERELNFILDNKELLAQAKTPKIIINETFSLTQSYAHTLYGNQNPDMGGVVNFTNTRGHYHKSILDLAESVATRFEQEVLNAF